MSDAPRIGPESDEAAPRAWPSTVIVGGIAALLYLSFVRYGFNLEDEGTILYQILRTFRGERPYLDFHTGYTPAMFYLNAGLLQLFGVSVLPLRLFLVAVHVVTVVLLFRLSLRVAPALESACAALSYAVFLPFFAGQFASFNIPYPAWYAVASWLGAELASIKSIETGQRSWLMIAAALAGIAFSFKPNTGVLALGAVVLTQLLASRPIAGWLGGWLEGILLLLAGVGVCAVLAFDFFTEQFLLLGVPLLVLLAGIARARGRARRQLAPGDLRGVGAGLIDVAAIVASFLLVAGSWLAYFLPRLGLGRFSEEVLLLGAGVERIYLLYYPDISGWSVATLIALAAAWVVPYLVARGILGRRGLALLLGVGLALGVAALLVFGLAPEGIVLSIVLQLENLSYFLIPLVLAGAVLLWVVRLERPDAFAAGGLEPRLALVGGAIVYALLLFLQLYPRIDFMHVVISMPSALVIGAGALYRLESWWVRQLAAGRAVDARADAQAWAWVRAALVTPVVLVLLARGAPMLDARLEVDDGFAPRKMTRMESAIMPIELERDRDRDLRELAAVAEFVTAHTGPHEPIVTFPALAIVPFLTDRATPVPHDYFFAGRPSHAEEAAMVRRIAETRPPLVVTLNDRFGYFSASPAYYFILRDYLLRSYVLVRRFGRFDVLARRDLAETVPGWERPMIEGEGFSTRFARGRLREELVAARRLAKRGSAEDLRGLADRLADVDRAVRGAYARAFGQVAARDPGGYAAVERAVAPDRRARLLFVRALGEWGDTDAVPYLQDVFLASQGRLRWEAARSINYVLARKLADRFRLHDPPTGPLWNLSRPLESEAMVALLDDFVERQRIGPLAAVATAHAGRGDLAPRLEHFESERETTWWRMIAALSLVELGERRHLRTMLDALNEGTLAEQYVPSLLLDPALIARPDVSQALLETLGEGSEAERETVAWMLPYLDTPNRDALLEVALRDPSAFVRRAAEWARETARERAAAAPAAGRESS